jgi:hypothetical protein
MRRRACTCGARATLDARDPIAIGFRHSNLRNCSAFDFLFSAALSDLRGWLQEFGTIPGVGDKIDAGGWRNRRSGWAAYRQGARKPIGYGLLPPI